jgi:ribosomal subunit interface protein
MDIRVSGHQMETGEALRVHVEDRLNTIVDKHFNRALSSVVTFGKAPGGSFRCDIVTHVRQGLILKGAGIAHDAHQSLDQAAVKIETQLRRYKRLNDRHEQAAHAGAEDAAYTIFEEPDHDEGRNPCRNPSGDRGAARGRARGDRFGCGDDAGSAQHQCLAVQKRWHRKA